MLRTTRAVEACPVDGCVAPTAERAGRWPRRTRICAPLSKRSCNLCARASTRCSQNSLTSRALVSDNRFQRAEEAKEQSTRALVSNNRFERVEETKEQATRVAVRCCWRDGGARNFALKGVDQVRKPSGLYGPPLLCLSRQGPVSKSLEYGRPCLPPTGGPQEL
jgi:hypothetical protein